MERRINFNDGTYLSVAGEDTYLPEYMYTYSNAILLIKNGTNRTSIFTTDKTDKDGNIWRLNGSGNSLNIRIYWGGGSNYSTLNIDANSYQSYGFFFYSSTRPTKLRYTWPGVAAGTAFGIYYETIAGPNDFYTDVRNQPNKPKFDGESNFGLIYYSGNQNNEGLNITLGGLDIDLTRFTHSYQEIPDETDPYHPGGESGHEGGSGDFDGTGDDIDIPSLPTLSAVDTGFITLFNPSAGELRSLANYMWSNPLFDLDAWKKIFANPMDAILGLSIVPVAVPNGGSANVTVGNISTGVSMTKAGAQYVAVDCGTLNVNEYWGAYLDYDPYTRAEIYLPYIGTHPLAVDDIMNKPVHVVYHIDILSGACCAFIKCGGSVLYSFVGQCSCSIPITGNDWTNVVNGALSIAASIGTMVATGGASAPMSVTAIASAAVNSMKPNVEKSGSMGGMGGMLGIQVPYLILTRPRQALPRSQNRFIGYPSFITRQLSDISGYTEIESIHLDGVPATEQELSEIVSLLKSGVIL